jgi:hypothetical protein
VVPDRARAGTGKAEAPAGPEGADNKKGQFTFSKAKNTVECGFYP